MNIISEDTDETCRFLALVARQHIGMLRKFRGKRVISLLGVFISENIGFIKFVAVQNSFASYKIAFILKFIVYEMENKLRKWAQLEGTVRSRKVKYPYVVSTR